MKKIKKKFRVTLEYDEDNQDIDLDKLIFWAIKIEVNTMIAPYTNKVTNCEVKVREVKF